jgi:hypothetical protein
VPDEVAIPLAIAIAAFVQGYGGFGFGIIAMALVGLLSPSLASASTVVMIVATPVVAWLMKLSWRDGPIDWRNIGRLFAGALVGIPLGYWFLLAFGDQPLGRFVLGVVLFGFCVVGLLTGRGRVPMGKAWGLPMGAISGFIGGAFVSGGPPVVVYLYAQGDDPRAMKPTIQVIFLVMLLMRIVAAAGTGALARPRVWMLAGLSLPLATALLAAGHWLSLRAKVTTFRLAVQALIGLFGLLLMALTYPHIFT